MGKKTPKPTGLAVSRSGGTFNFTWNGIKKSTDHDIKVYLNGSCVATTDLGKKTTANSYWVNLGTIRKICVSL